MSRLRIIEEPLGEDAKERPPRAAWMAMFEDAKLKPVPPYELKRALGLVLPRRNP